MPLMPENQATAKIEDKQIQSSPNILNFSRIYTKFDIEVIECTQMSPNPVSSSHHEKNIAPHCQNDSPKLIPFTHACEIVEPASTAVPAAPQPRPIDRWTAWRPYCHETVASHDQEAAGVMILRAMRLQYLNTAFETQNLFLYRYVKIPVILLNNKEILSVQRMSVGPYSLCDVARCVGAHLTITILPHWKPQNRLFSIATTIMEIAKPPQRKAMKSCSAESTHCFHVCPMHAVHP